MEKKLSLGFYGGAGIVTGSNFLFSSGENKILVDCGLFQGRRMCEDLNRGPFLYNPAEIQALFVTHAHVDHVGRIPKLVKAGFRGKIFSTPPTREIAELMLTDSLDLLRREAERFGDEPLFTAEDISHAFSHWETVSYHESVSIGDLKISFKDSGHILGAGYVEITHNGEKTVFTGDLGNFPAPLMNKPEPLTDVSYLVIESVYGDRNHENRNERKSRLEDVCEETIKSGGVLLIPAFSLERTQELLFELNDLVEKKRVPRVPVFLDSPLAIDITRIYKKYESYFNPNAREIIKNGDDIFKFPGLVLAHSKEESLAIDKVPGPKIIIAGSGMSHGGRIMRHEKKYLPDPKNAILFVGYQAPGSIGRLIEEGVKEVDFWGETVSCRAKTYAIHSYSAHMDSDSLLEFIAQTRDSLKKVFCVMGEPKASGFLAQRIQDYLGVPAVVPLYGRTVDLVVH